MSVKAISSVWQHSKQKGGALLVELAIADFADDQGRAWPAIETLANKARMTPRNVNYIIEKKLKPAGLVIKQNGGPHRSNLYRLCITVKGEADFTLKSFQDETHFPQTLKPISPNPSLNRHIRESGALAPTHSQSKSQRCGVDKQLLSAPQTAPPHPKEKQTRAAAADPRVKPFLTWFAEEYEKRHGVPYAVRWGKDGKLVKELPPAFDLPRLKDLAVQFLESSDPWVRQNGGFTVGVFISQINKLASTGNGHAKPPEVKKLGGGWLELDGMKISQKDYDRRWKTA